MIPPLKNVTIHAHFLSGRPAPRDMLVSTGNREVDFLVFAHACIWIDAFNEIMNKIEEI